MARSRLVQAFICVGLVSLPAVWIVLALRADTPLTEAQYRADPA